MVVPTDDPIHLVVVLACSKSTAVVLDHKPSFDVADVVVGTFPSIVGLGLQQVCKAYPQYS